MLFGSELFEEYIGQLAMASMASLDVFAEGEEFDAKKLQEKMRVNFFSFFFIVFKLHFHCLFIKLVAKMGGLLLRKSSYTGKGARHLYFFVFLGQTMFNLCDIPTPGFWKLHIPLLKLKGINP